MNTRGNALFVKFGTFFLLLVLLEHRTLAVAKVDDHEEVVKKTKQGYEAFKKGDLELAMKCANEALRLDKKKDLDVTAKAYVLRSVVYTSQKKPDLAIAEASEAIKVRPTAHYAYFARARGHEYKEDYRKAVEDMTKAIELSSEPRQQSGYYEQRAIYYRQLGEDERAKADERKAKELAK